MPEQSIIIKFQAKGNERLTRAINKLDDATRELKGQTARMRKESGLLDTSFQRNTKNANIFNVALATLRSRLLIGAFAMSMFIKPLMRLSGESGRVKALENAFIDLTGGVGKADERLTKLQDATDNTMSKFDLFTQANNAMILGVTRNTDEMAEMFDQAQRLGEAVGRDAASSVESLITGIGRQSRLMLDNIGIIVDTEKSYKNYARAINISVKNLTDGQKKQAFMTATLDAARTKLIDLGEETTNIARDFQRLAAVAKNLVVPAGNALNFMFGKQVRAVTAVALKLEDFFTETALEKFTKLRNKTIDQSNRFMDFSKQVRKARREFFEFLGTFAQLPKDLTIGMVDEQANINLKNFLEKLDKVPEKFLNIDISTREINPRLAAANKFMNGISDAAADAAINSKKVGKEIGNAIKNIALQITAQAAAFLLFAPILNMFGGVGLATGAGGGLGLRIGNAFKFALGIAHTGGLIKDNKVQKFATGGVVQGEDNVPILAQNGEFVMSRNAVESVGIETMNRINQTGSAGVTVNVSGNVMSQDFVEGELAERIKEAVRKGSNFGMS